MMTQYFIYLTLHLIIAAGQVHAGCNKPLRDWVGDEMDCNLKSTPWIQRPEKLPYDIPMRARRTLPPGFIIANSTIPGAGLGVFSTMFIPRFTWLDEYEGDIILSGCDIGDYAWLIFRGDKLYFHVDGGREEMSNWLRFINCSRRQTEENVLMVQCFDKVFYLAGRDIVPGEEMLVYYGNSYARELGIDVDAYKHDQYT